MDQTSRVHLSALAARRRTRRVLPAGFLLAAVICTAPSGARADATITALTGQSCAGTRSATTLNCTANDFTSFPSFSQPPGNTVTSCVAGSAISLDVIATVTSNQANRYDVALFLGEVGNAPGVNDATKACSLGVFPNTPAPWYDTDADSCGDYTKSSTSALTVQGVQVQCKPAPGTNVVGIEYLLAFDNQSTGGCTAANVTAAASSKCVSSTAGTGVQVAGVVVQGWVQLTQQTNPSGASGTFGFTAGGSATPSPTSFSLSDTQTQTVQIPLSATGGSQTLQLDQAALSGWVSGATIACTNPTGGSASSYVVVDGASRRITATPTGTNYGAICTITNEKLATVAISEQSSGGTAAFSFTGGTNGLPASLSLDTSTGNPKTSSAYVVTANSTSTAITQTVAADWTLTGAGCTDGGSSFGSLAGGTLTIAAGNVLPGKTIVCTFTDTRNATLTKAFSPAGVNTGSPSTLTFTVTNSTGNPAQSGIGFTDTFPGNLVVASPLTTGRTCGGTLYRGGTTTPLAAGDGSVKLSGGTLGDGTGACTVSVAVSSASAGSYVNGASAIGSLSSLSSGVTDQTLTVTAAGAPSLLLVKSADHSPVLPGDVVTYAVQVQNSGSASAYSVLLSDAMPRFLGWSLNAFGAGTPFRFTDGLPASGVSLGTPAYSSDGGATWTYTPVSGGGGAPSGYDAAVTNWRIPMSGNMTSGRQFTLEFMVVVR